MKHPLVAFAFALLLSPFACSSDSGGSGGESPCTAVCNCVVGVSGEQARAQCNQECSDALKTADPAQTCRDRLSANNLSQCSGNCNAVTAAPSGGGGPPAAIGEFCQKCSTCVSDPNFSEGFCDPYKTGTGFDVTACTNAHDVASLANPSASSATLASWTCQQFDDNE